MSLTPSPVAELNLPDLSSEYLLTPAQKESYCEKGHKPAQPNRLRGLNTRSSNKRASEVCHLELHMPDASLRIDEAQAFAVRAHDVRKSAEVTPRRQSRLSRLQAPPPATARKRNTKQ